MPLFLDNPTESGPVNDRILAAALALFVERGYHNVSVHDIQRRAGVSIGSIYNHFGGKEGVARALYARALEEMLALVEGVMDMESGLEARSRRLIQRLFEYTESRTTVIAFVFQARHREFLPDEPPICSAAPFRRLREMVETGMVSGEIRAGNTWVAAAALFGGAIRLVQLRLDGLLEQPLPVLAQETWERAWCGLRAEPQSPPHLRDSST